MEEVSSLAKELKAHLPWHQARILFIRELTQSLFVVRLIYPQNPGLSRFDHFALRDQIHSLGIKFGFVESADQLKDVYPYLQPEPMLYSLLYWVTQTYPENRPSINELHETLQKWLEQNPDP